MSSVNNPTLISVEILKNSRKIRGFEKVFVHEDSVCLNIILLFYCMVSFYHFVQGFSHQHTEIKQMKVEVDKDRLKLRNISKKIINH